MDQGSAAGATAREARRTLALAWPIVMTQLGEVAIGAIDTAMIGRLGAQPLAAATAGVNLFFLAVVFAIGVASGTQALAAQALGAGDRAAIPRIVRAGVWAALLVGLPVAALVWSAAPWALQALGQPAGTVELGGRYLALMAWVIPFAALFVAVRSFAAALSRPGPALVAMWLAVAANVPLNWLLIYGNLGFPAMGVEGAAVASILVNLLMVAAVAAVVRIDPVLRRWRALRGLHRLDPARLRRALAVGLPIGATLVVEVGVFVGAAVLIGWLGEAELAAHGVVMQIAAVAFMVPLGIGLAACTRVGEAWGAASPSRARRAAWTATVLAGAAMCASAALLLAAPDLLIGLFVDVADPANAAVVAEARRLLVIAALFQVVDGLQVAQQNALRGAGDVRWPFLVSLVGYWGVGLGAGAVLAFPGGMGAAGVWWGLAAGLAAVSALLAGRMIRRFPGAAPRAEATGAC